VTLSQYLSFYAWMATCLKRIKIFEIEYYLSFELEYLE